MLTVDLGRRESLAAASRCDDVVGADLRSIVSKTMLVAALHVGGADAEPHLARIQPVEIDQPCRAAP
jgi:hypothetical protein